MVPATTPGLSGLARRYVRALPRGGGDTLRRQAQRAEATIRLTAATPTRSATRLLQELAAREPNPALRKYQLGVLSTRRNLVPPAERRQLGRLLGEAFPRQPLVPREGTVEIRHYVGDEFFRSELALLRREGFQVRQRGRLAEARRGRLHVVVRGSDENVFRDMSDPRVHVVLFSGHSNVGGVNELSLRTAPEQRGDKLIVSLQCIGKQTMPLLAGRFPLAHILTTRDSSLDYEDRNMIRALYTGLERGEGYRQIRKRARAEESIKNYLFPDQAQQTRTGWDLDRDGRPDFRGRQLHDLRFDVADGRTRFPGQKVLSAVQYLNAANKYYVEDTPGAIFRTSQIRERFRSAGIAEQPLPEGQMTLLRANRDGRRQVTEVLLNPRYARAPRAFVAAASIYEMELSLAGARGGRASDDHRAIALLMATDYLYRLVPTWQEVDRAMRMLCRFKRLPGVSYDQLEGILRTNLQQIGTERQMREVKRLLQAGD